MDNNTIKSKIEFLTPKQRQVFDNLCVGWVEGTKSTFDQLAKKGLLNKTERSFDATSYSVPNKVHLVWSGLCNESKIK